MVEEIPQWKPISMVYEIDVRDSSTFKMLNTVSCKFTKEYHDFPHAKQ